jgi:hypothetical protein
MVKFYLAGRLQFVSDAWILLDQYVIAPGSTDATSDGFLSIRSFRSVRARGVIILRQQKAARNEQCKQQVSHRGSSSPISNFHNFEMVPLLRRLQINCGKASI